MPYLIGTDEAGYAPNLGPLVVSASVWWVEDAADGLDLYQRLKRVVSKSPPRATAAVRSWTIADSKVLYSPAQGLAMLERGVLAALSLVDRCPDDWQDVWQSLHPEAIDELPSMPWHVDYDLRLPLAADVDDLARLVPKLRRQLSERGVRLVAVASRAVFPGEFNARTESDGNKSESLSKITLALVAEMLELCRGESTLVVCDKHGGRNYYNRLLQEQFPDPLVEVRRESNQESVYAWGPDDERIEVRFRAGGESFLPAALASMTSKYLRELAMLAFNDFWCARIEDLRPTAGYPKDARRFRAAIRETQLALGIADHILWRNR